MKEKGVGSKSPRLGSTQQELHALSHAIFVELTVPAAKKYLGNAWGFADSYTILEASAVWNLLYKDVRPRNAAM